MHTVTAKLEVLHTVTAKLEVLHTVTEIWTFAARLPARGADRPTGSVGNLGRGSSVGFCGAAPMGRGAALGVLLTRSHTLQTLDPSAGARPGFMNPPHALFRHTVLVAMRRSAARILSVTQCWCGDF